MRVLSSFLLGFLGLVAIAMARSDAANVKANSEFEYLQSALLSTEASTTLSQESCCCFLGLDARLWDNVLGRTPL
jgi:hypothetical protein